jgi:hypothetical protein
VHLCLVAPFRRTWGPAAGAVFLDALILGGGLDSDPGLLWRGVWGALALAVGFVLTERPKHAWLDGETLVTRTSRVEIRLPLSDVDTLRFESGGRDMGSVILHSPQCAVELEGAGWNTRALRFEVGRRLHLIGTVRESQKQDLRAWKRLGVDIVDTRPVTPLIGTIRPSTDRFRRWK